MFHKIKKWFFDKPKNPAGNVYYARLKTPQGVYYKLGYTSKSSLSERMSYGGQGDELLIDREFFFTFHPDAWNIEQKLLDYFNKERAFGRFSNDKTMPLAGRGQSELFLKDVLGLDDEIYQDKEKLVDSVEVSSDEKEGCLLILIGLIISLFIPFLGVPLLILFFGASAFLGKKSKNKSLLSKVKPQHSTEMQELIDMLVCTRNRAEVKNRVRS